MTNFEIAVVAFGALALVSAFLYLAISSWRDRRKREERAQVPFRGFKLDVDGYDITIDVPDRGASDRQILDFGALYAVWRHTCADQAGVAEHMTLAYMRQYHADQIRLHDPLGSDDG